MILNKNYMAPVRHEPTAKQFLVFTVGAINNILFINCMGAFLQAIIYYLPCLRHVVGT
jgi:hypothetical protein